MRIQVGTLTSKVLHAERAEWAWLTEYLSFEDSKNRFRGRAGQSESLLNRNTDRFPSGLLRMVEKAGAAEGFRVDLIDARTPPCREDPAADLAWLRDYQVTAVKAIVKKGRGVLWLPTGSGKTEIIVGLTRALPCFWLALVHRAQLADDMAARWEKRTPGLQAGRILEGAAEIPPDATFVAATFQTLARWLKNDPGDPNYELAKDLLAKAEGLIVDEAHTLPADSFYVVAMKTVNAYYRVGLSGTPLARGDAKSMKLLAAIGPVVNQVKTQLLVDRGVLAKPTVRLVTVLQASNRPTWTGVYGECIVRGQSRNEALVAMAKRATMPGFLFVQQVAHGRDLTKLLGRGGIKAEFVWGKHSLSYRKSLIRRLVQGHFDVLVCSSVFQEGIDVPELRSVIIGSGGKSVIATLQRLGRGIRVDRKADGSVHEGGDRFEVWDVKDMGNKWLERHARTRLNAYTGEGFETFIEAPGQLTLPKL